MQERLIERGATSVILHVYIEDASTGDGKTGLAFNTGGLVIAAIRPGEAAATVYDGDSGDLETVATIGTYATPTVGKARFREIDAAALAGWYEVHLDAALLNASGNLRGLSLSAFGAAGMKQANLWVQLLGVSLQGAGVTVSTNNDKAGYFLANDSIFAATFHAGAITATVLADGTITAAKIDADAITAAKIATGAITNAKFAVGAIDAAAVADGAIDAGAFAQGAADKVWITTTRQLTGTQVFNLTGNITGNVSGSVGSIATGGIVAGSFGSGAITASAFAANAITATVVADGAIAAGKFAQGAADKVWATAARTLTAGVDLTAGAVDAVWDEVLEASFSARQMMRGIAAGPMGLRAGGATSTLTLLGLDGVTVRITHTSDASGNSTGAPVLNLN